MHEKMSVIMSLYTKKKYTGSRWLLVQYWANQVTNVRAVDKTSNAFLSKQLFQIFCIDDWVKKTGLINF